MKRILKIAGALAALAAVLLIAAAVAVRVLLPPAKLKSLAISAAGKSLHRKLEVRSVDFGLFTGLRIEGLRLSETPDFSKGVFVTADSFVLSPQWLPLLRKEIVASKIELTGASVSVVKDASGKLNFSDLLAAPSSAGKKPAAPAGSAAAPGAALALAVHSLRLKDVAVRFADKRAGAKANVTLNEFAADGFSLSGPFSVSMDVRADYAAPGRRLSGAFKAAGKANLGGGDPSRASADFPDVSVALEDKKLAGSFRFENASAPNVSFSLRAPAMDAKFVNAALGEDALPAGARVPAIKAQATLAYAAPSVTVSAFKLSAAGAELSGSASVADVNAKNPKAKLEASTNEFRVAPLLDVLPQLRGAGLDGKASVKLSASTAGGILRLARLELRLADLDAKISGTVGGLAAKTRTLDLKLDTNRFQLASLAQGVDSMKPFGLGGAVSLSAAVAGTSAAPKASGVLTLDGVAAKFRGQTLEKTSGRALFTQDSVNMPLLTGRLNGGDFSLKASAADSGSPVVTVSGHLSLLDLGVLQKLAAGPATPASSTARGASAPPARSSRAPAPPPLRTSGDLTVDRTTHPNFECGKATLAWNLSGITPDMTRLAGTAKLSVGAGKAARLLDYAAARGGLVRALVVPLAAVQKARGLHIPGFNPPDMQNVPFDRIAGDFTAARGVVSMQPFLLEGPVIGMTTTGTVDLPAETANLKTAVKTGLGELDLEITGPLSSPKVRPNLTKQLQKTGKKLLEKEGQQLLNQFLHR